MPHAQGQLTIRTDGGADELFELLDWFNTEDELRGRVSLPDNRIQPGRMGDLYEVLTVAVGAGGLAPVLVRSLAGWFTHRRSDMTVTLTLDGDRTEITVDAKRINAPEVTRALQTMLEHTDPPQ
ncbi:effector-associated constant component EACC1 [Nocardia heshunensis]